MIVNFRTATLTCACLDSIRQHVRPATYEVVVVDNASGDDSVAKIGETHPWVTLVALHCNGGFGSGNNAGVLVARGRFVFLLNSDAQLTCDAPNALADLLDRLPDVICVGPRIVLPTGDRQPQVFGHQPTLWRVLCQSLGLSRLPWPRKAFEGIDARRVRGEQESVGWLSGVCMSMRTRDYQDVGGFDPRFFMYCEDIDLCRRLGRRGRILHIDAFSVIHIGGASSPETYKRVRNAVWQQRNLLEVVALEHGSTAMACCRVVMTLGQSARLLVGMLQPSLEGGYLLRSSWARLVDLVRPGKAI